MRAALVQASPPADVGQILVAAAGWIRQAAEAGAQLVVFPELFFPGFAPLTDVGRKLPAIADSIPGDASTAVAGMAARHKVHVVFTLLERAEDGNFYNAAVLVDPNGKLLHAHRKTLLTPGLDNGLSRGDRYQVATTDLGRIGMLICADATCPEGPRLLALQDAEIICVSSGDYTSTQMVDGHDIVETIWTHCSAAPTRAVENVVFWLAVNPSGRQGRLTFFGGSRAISPLGEEIAVAPRSTDEQLLLIADLDLSLIGRVEEVFPIKQRRRPDIYSGLTV